MQSGDNIGSTEPDMQAAGDGVRITGIIGDALKICYGSPRKFIGMAALVGLPSLALTVLNIARDPHVTMSPEQALIGLLQVALVVASFILSIYFTGALPLLTVHILDDRPMGWTDAFSWINDRRLFWGVVLAMFLVWLAVVGGLLLLIVPGLIFGTWFMLAVPARVLGDHPGSKALSESRRLISPVLLRAFGLGCLLVLPMVAVVATTQVVFSAIYGFASNSAGRIIPPAILGYLVGVFWMPVIGVALALLYIERAGGLAALRKDLFL